MELIHHVTFVTETWGRQGERSKGALDKTCRQRASILATNPEYYWLTCFRCSATTAKASASGAKRTHGLEMTRGWHTDSSLLQLRSCAACQVGPDYKVMKRPDRVEIC